MALVAMALPLGARAQVSGTINEGAPRVTTTLELGENSKLELRYTAIHYGKGRWRMLPGRVSKQAEFNAMAQRLRFSLEPGDAPNSATFGFAFGTHVLTIPLEPRSAEHPCGKPAATEGTKSAGKSKPPDGGKPPHSKKPAGAKSAGKREGGGAVSGGRKGRRGVGEETGGDGNLGDR